MDNGGHLVFGVQGSGQLDRERWPARKAYNDGQWHMVTATMSASGHGLLRRRRPGRPALRHHPGRDLRRLLADGRRRARRLAEPAEQPQLRRLRRRGRDLPDRARARTRSSRSTRPAGALRSSRRLRATRTARRSTPTIPTCTGASASPAAATALDSGRSLNTGTYYNGVHPRPGRRASPGTPPPTFDGNDGIRLLQRPVLQSDGLLRGGLVQHDHQPAAARSSASATTRAGSSGSYDRHVYMQDDGKLVFGVWTGQTNTITTPGAYNDGSWHHVVATQAGRRHEAVRRRRTDRHQRHRPHAQTYNGYWKVGGDNTWGSSSAYFNGTIDEAAVYSYELGADRVTAHFLAGGGHLNAPPAAAFTASTDQRRATFDAAGSSDPDGTVAGVRMGLRGQHDGHRCESGPHVLRQAGTYTVKLTVTDNKGAASVVSHDVVVTVPNGPGDNYGAAVFADSPTALLAARRVERTHGGRCQRCPEPRHLLTTVSTLGAVRGLADRQHRRDVRRRRRLRVVRPTRSTTRPPTPRRPGSRPTRPPAGRSSASATTPIGSSNNYDRHVYMQDDGHLVFGTYTGQLNTITSDAAYNNDQWHHVVATQGSDGMKLYVDGVLVGTNSQTQAAGLHRLLEGRRGRHLGLEQHYFERDHRRGRRLRQGAESQLRSPPITPRRLRHRTRSRLQRSRSTRAICSVTADASDFIRSGRHDRQLLRGTSVTAGLPTGPIAGHTYDGQGDVHDHADGDRRRWRRRHGDARGHGEAGQCVADRSTSPPRSIISTSAWTQVRRPTPDGTIDSYAWDFGDDTTGSRQDGHPQLPAGRGLHGDADGDRRRRRDGHREADRHGYRAAPSRLSLCSPARPIRSLLSVDGSASSDPDGTVTGYAWDFGDNATGSGASRDPYYAASGTYAVKLTVTDNDGKTGTITQQVNVTRNNTSPTASFTTNGHRPEGGRRRQRVHRSGRHDQELRLELWRRQDRDREDRLAHVTTRRGRTRSR